MASGLSNSESVGKHSLEERNAVEETNMDVQANVYDSLENIREPEVNQKLEAVISVPRNDLVRCKNISRRDIFLVSTLVIVLSGLIGVLYSYLTIIIAVNGNWASWSPWSPCNITLENGTHTRTRACADPAPSKGGLDCIGPQHDAKPCRYKPYKECYDVGFGHLYKGFQTRTVTGKTCQRWDADEPHEPRNININKFPDRTIADAENFCRDPHKYGRPWCYTIDPKTKWDYCDIQQCSSRNCYKVGFSRLYQGNTSVTSSKMTCQRWDAQSPHSHNYTNPETYPDPTLAEANNHCRDPSLTADKPWCFTTGSERWEYCDIEPCTYDFCYDGKPWNYRGKVSTTDSGVKCQRWDAAFPHKHNFGKPSNFPDASVSDAKNFCRDPSKHGRAWCYTTKSLQRWDYCAIKECGEI